MTKNPTNHWSEGGITHFHRGKLSPPTLRAASLNSNVGHLTIIDDKYLADQLVPISQPKQSSFGCSFRKRPNAFSVVSIAAHAFRRFSDFANERRMIICFLDGGDACALARSSCLWISQLSAV